MLLGETITPLSISMLLRHLANDDDDFKIGGISVETIKFVGQIISLDKTESTWTFDLDDSTGTIACGWVVPSNPSPWWEEYMSAVTEGAYVTVHGIINVFQRDTPPFNVMFLFPVEINEEIFLHQITCAEFYATANNTKQSENIDQYLPETSVGMTSGGGFFGGFRPL